MFGTYILFVQWFKRDISVLNYIILQFTIYYSYSQTSVQCQPIESKSLRVGLNFMVCCSHHTPQTDIANFLLLKYIKIMCTSADTYILNMCQLISCENKNQSNLVALSFHSTKCNVFWVNNSSLQAQAMVVILVTNADLLKHY